MRGEGALSKNNLKIEGAQNEITLITGGGGGGGAEKLDGVGGIR